MRARNITSPKNVALLQKVVILFFSSQSKSGFDMRSDEAFLFALQIGLQKEIPHDGLHYPIHA